MNSTPVPRQYLAQHKYHLVQFWNEYGGPAHDPGSRSRKSKVDTIEGIQRMGLIVLSPSPKARSYGFNRHQYDTYKRHLNGYTRFRQCFACGGPSQCRHHLIWLKHGGRNHKRNIVPLCNPCHAEIHPWLKIT